MGGSPCRAEVAYLVHAGLGGILTLAALCLLHVAPRERIGRAGVRIGLAGLVLGACGGMLTAYHPARWAGLLLMLVGTLGGTPRLPLAPCRSRRTDEDRIEPRSPWTSRLGFWCRAHTRTSLVHPSGRLDAATMHSGLTARRDVPRSCQRLGRSGAVACKESPPTLSRCSIRRRRARASARASWSARCRSDRCTRGASTESMTSPERCRSLRVASCRSQCSCLRVPYNTGTTPIATATTTSGISINQYMPAMEFGRGARHLLLEWIRLGTLPSGPCDAVGVTCQLSVNSLR